MGGRTPICLVNVSNHASQINKGNPLFDDLWSRGCYSFRDRLPNTKDHLIQFK